MPVEKRFLHEFEPTKEGEQLGWFDVNPCTDRDGREKVEVSLAIGVMEEDGVRLGHRILVSSNGDQEGLPRGFAEGIGVVRAISGAIALDVDDKAGYFRRTAYLDSELERGGASNIFAEGCYHHRPVPIERRSFSTDPTQLVVGLRQEMRRHGVEDAFEPLYYGFNALTAHQVARLEHTAPSTFMAVDVEKLLVAHPSMIESTIQQLSVAQEMANLLSRMRSSNEETRAELEPKEGFLVSKTIEAFRSSREYLVASEAKVVEMTGLMAFPLYMERSSGSVREYPYFFDAAKGQPEEASGVIERLLNEKRFEFLRKELDREAEELGVRGRFAIGTTSMLRRLTQKEMTTAFNNTRIQF